MNTVPDEILLLAAGHVLRFRIGAAQTTMGRMQQVCQLWARLFVGMIPLPLVPFVPWLPPIRDPLYVYAQALNYLFSDGSAVLRYSS